MTPAPVPPGTVREKAAAAYRNRRGKWIADPHLAAADALTIGLHPPTEAAVADAPDAAVAWVRAWRSYGGPGTVDWQRRRWPSFGTQSVPVRLTLAGASAIAQAAGTSREWRSVLQRRAALTALATTDVPASGPASAPGRALARTATRWLALDDDDFGLLVRVVQWISEHPASGLYIRQLPIPGVDTKWVTRHRGLVTDLLDGLRGDGDLGVHRLPRICDVAVCDRTLLPGTPRHFAAPLDELAELDVRPARVLLLENKEGLYALNRLPGTLALHGGGYAVHELAALPWMGAAECLYWGDADTHGFAILDRLRGHLPHVRSLLMDTATLDAWGSLTVDEPKPAGRADLPNLTDGERAVFARVRDRGLRLEQERIPWPYVEEALRALGPTG